MSHRWLLAVLVGSLVCGGMSPAQDGKRMEDDKAKKIGRLLVEATGKLTDLPVPVKPDVERCTGLEANKRGGLVVPDAHLTADAMKALDKRNLALGVLYLHKITLVVAEQPLPADKHRTVEVAEGDKKATVNVLHLAAANVAGRPVLLVYAGGKTPAMVTTLADVEEKSEYPLDLEARPAGEEMGAATILLNVLGRYRAAIPVAAQD